VRYLIYKLLNVKLFGYFGGRIMAMVSGGRGTESILPYRLCLDLQFISALTASVV
jgi:hypothetical protein